MAWIESHQALGNHPKLLKLARAMGWSRADTLGRLHLFWHWCLDYAVDGQLEKHGTDLVSDVFDVPDSDREKFVTALRASEFIDFTPSLRVHDWWDYAGKFLQVRYKRTPKVWKQIKRLYVPYKQPTNNRPTTELSGENNHKPNLTRPNLTRPNQTKPLKTPPTPPTDLGETSVEMVHRTKPNWELVWDGFPPNPHKVGRADVRKWFERKKPRDDVVATMLNKLHQLANSDQWQSEGGKFIPSPMTWLNQCRWEDEVSAPGPRSPTSMLEVL